jgi:hypothetical protein
MYLALILKTNLAHCATDNILNLKLKSLMNLFLFFNEQATFHEKIWRKMMRELTEGECWVMVAAMITAAITIIATSFNLKNDTCVDEKVENAQLLIKNAELINARKYIETGVCYDFEDSGQRVCRNGKMGNSMADAGKIYVTDLPLEGIVSQENNE